MKWTHSKEDEARCGNEQAASIEVEQISEQTKVSTCIYENKDSPTFTVSVEVYSKEEGAGAMVVGTKVN